jgi:hypothetical protein
VPPCEWVESYLFFANLQHDRSRRLPAHHAQAVVEAGRIAVASLAVTFPELQGLTSDDQVRGAVNAMRQMNPQR